MSQGRLYTISAPSGAGKTSLVKALLACTDNLEFSVSHTTRAKRNGEQDGQDYFFVDQHHFLQLLKDGEFLEHAHVFDHYYGTSRSIVENHLKNGVDVLLEIDWQGARQIRQQSSHNIGIFILPPSRNVLRQRLLERGEDNPETIERRMQDAIDEISHYNEADYIIINDDFDTALRQASSIIDCARLRQSAQISRHKALLESLLAP